MSFLFAKFHATEDENQEHTYDEEKTQPASEDDWVAVGEAGDIYDAFRQWRDTELCDDAERFLREYEKDHHVTDAMRVHFLQDRLCSSECESFTSSDTNDTCSDTDSCCGCSSDEEHCLPASVMRAIDGNDDMNGAPQTADYVCALYDDWLHLGKDGLVGYFLSWSGERRVCPSLLAEFLAEQEMRREVDPISRARLQQCCDEFRHELHDEVERQERIALALRLGGAAGTFRSALVKLDSSAATFKRYMFPECELGHDVEKILDEHVAQRLHMSQVCFCAGECNCNDYEGAVRAKILSLHVQNHQELARLESLWRSQRAPTDTLKETFIPFITSFRGCKMNERVANEVLEEAALVDGLTDRPGEGELTEAALESASEDPMPLLADAVASEQCTATLESASEDPMPSLTDGVANEQCTATLLKDVWPETMADMKTDIVVLYEAWLTSKPRNIEAQFWRWLQDRPVHGELVELFAAHMESCQSLSIIELMRVRQCCTQYSELDEAVYRERILHTALQCPGKSGARITRSIPLCDGPETFLRYLLPYRVATKEEVAQLHAYYIQRRASIRLLDPVKRGAVLTASFEILREANRKTLQQLYRTWDTMRRTNTMECFFAYLKTEGYQIPEETAADIVREYFKHPCVQKQPQETLRDRLLGAFDIRPLSPPPEQDNEHWRSMVKDAFEVHFLNDDGLRATPLTEAFKIIDKSGAEKPPVESEIVIGEAQGTVVEPAVQATEETAEELAAQKTAAAELVQPLVTWYEVQEFWPYVAADKDRYTTVVSFDTPREALAFMSEYMRALPRARRNNVYMIERAG